MFAAWQEGKPMKPPVCLLRPDARVTQRCEKHLHVHERLAVKFVRAGVAKWAAPGKLFLTVLSAGRGYSAHPSPPRGHLSSDARRGWYRLRLDQLVNGSERAAEFFEAFHERSK